MRASIVRVCLLCSLLLPAIASAAEPRTPAEFQQEIDAIRIALGVLKKRMEVARKGTDARSELETP